MSFADKTGLWTEDRQAAAAEAVRRIEADELEVVRISFPDQHGLLRGKTVAAADALKLMQSGVAITSTLLAKDTSNKTVLPIWSAGGAFGMAAFQGGGDVVMLPDPLSFRVLPWSPKSG